MPEKYVITWSFRNRPNELRDSIWSADRGCPKDVKFQLVDASSSVDSLENIRSEIRAMTGRDVRVCETSYRTTCQEAWNLGIMLSDAERIIIASSDVEFYSGWFEVIDHAFNEGFDYVILGNHAVFAIHRRLIGKIGWFDEAYGHGPHVDVDFMIRASEAKARIKILDNNKYYVHDKENLQYNDRINKDLKDRLPMGNPENEKRFLEKWATSWPGWEIYKGKNVDLPHPPTQISEVSRKIPEVDQHPAYTRRAKKC